MDQVEPESEPAFQKSHLLQGGNLVRFALCACRK
ncbi:predicted protein [Botrytis cinerea T4]|uniref:Uncharacterized protein n=1 Tax=Botryotinia fuckeliana (strain T4) TaxID=999810 RepID=G2YCK0_BOTF4|nr:predicted protein [Botrytis cinerea T4]